MTSAWWPGCRNSVHNKFQT